MEYKLFAPSSIDMFREYPELKEYKEFSDVKSNDELLFAWYFGNPTSEFAKEEKESSKRRLCYEKVWGKTDDTKYVQYLNGNFPELVRAAVEKMKSFKPSARMRAKLMTEKTFNDFEEIMNRGIGDLDMADIKKLADLKMDIAKQLPDLIKQMEAGFGVKEINVKDSDKRVATFADTIHDAMSRAN